MSILHLPSAYEISFTLAQNLVRNSCVFGVLAGSEIELGIRFPSGSGYNGILKSEKLFLILEFKSNPYRNLKGFGLKIAILADL